MKGPVLAFAIAVVAFVVSWLVVAVAGPDAMPMHYGLGGDVEEWGSRGRFLLNSVWGAVISAILITLALNASRLPDQFVNTPHRDYWLGDHRAEFNELVRGMMFGMASVLLTVFTLINVAGMWVRDAAWFFPMVLVLLILGLAIFIARPVIRLYREPKAAR